MTTRTRLFCAVCAFAFPAALHAQEKGYWRALSTSARGVTGDVTFTDTKIVLNFSGFTLAQIRTLNPGEAKAVFADAATPDGSGNLFRTDIPAEKHFLHKNSLCGAEEVQWVVTSVSGKTLQMALFSGSAMPKLTPEDIANTTALCGTYSYTR